MSTARISRNDPCPCGSGRKFKHCCLHHSNRLSSFDIGSFPGSTQPQPAPKRSRLHGDLRVKMFIRQSRQWKDTLLKDVPPGEEFIAFNRLHKVLEPEVYAENVVLDVSKIPDADRPFDRNNYDSPKARDVVYVFDEDDPGWGHCQLGNLNPGQRCVYQGRVYAIESGPTPDTCKLIGLNQVYSHVAPQLAECQKVMIQSVVVGETRVTCAPMSPSTGLEGTETPPSAEVFCWRFESLQQGDRTRPTEVVVSYTHPEMFGYAEVEIVVPADEYFRLPDRKSVSVLNLTAGLEIVLKDGMIGKVVSTKRYYDIPEPPNRVEHGLWASRVIGRVKHTTFEILEWRLGGELIEGTLDHLVWSVSRKSWIRAYEMKSGELVRPAGNFVLPVDSVGPRRTGMIEVFGIEVEFFHNYFVAPGDASMLVHNGPEYINRPAQANKLLENEGKVGTFSSLSKLGRRGDSLTPHHLPSDALMKAKVPGYTRGEGISMMMEAPLGGGGRHRLTASYGRSPDLSLTPRQALAAEIRDVRRIYMDQGLYTPEIRQSLLDVIRQNRTAWPGQF